MSSEYLTPVKTLNFQQALLSWYDKHGRKNLPWKQESTPYKVWVSEIMLQQTQVNTVIPYFLRFMERFPDIDTLSNAELETVLQYWSGLGYYARARNLHHCAQIISHSHAGKIPANLEQLVSLPGIGRSTAGAILSMGHHKPATILDGNVKRILSRYICLQSWPGTPENQRRLWALSEALTPEDRVGDYNQALMDLGATLCIRARPLCNDCPLNSDCSAFQQQLVAAVPVSKKARTLPIRQSWMLLLCNENNACYLEKRPNVGLWGGLWVFPSFNSEAELLHWCQMRHVNLALLEQWPKQRHTFSHFHLDFIPVIGQASSFSNVQDSNGSWLQADQAHAAPAPINRLLKQISK